MAVVNVTIAPGADVDRGRYSTELDLDWKDPARHERDSRWQQIDLDFQV
ncbi:MAG: hypothetical protein ABEH59_02185 [Halobacteriales archaeon]